MAERRQRYVRKLPAVLTVKVYPDEEQPDAWIADVPELDLSTIGGSPADAVAMAADALRTLAGECKRPHLEHCHCVSDERHGTSGKVCCICGNWTAAAALVEQVEV